MQFDSYKSFGYPVLRTIVQGENISLLDYQKANFDPSISKPQWNVESDPENFKIQYDLGLKLKTLLDAVTEGNASMYIYALCKKTFYSKLTKIDQQKGAVKYPTNLFRYDIELSAFVIANTSFDLVSDRFHEDFGNASFKVSKGDVLAWSQPSNYSCEKAQYRTMKSVFEFSKSNEVVKGKFLLKTDEDYVAISVHPEFLISIRRMETSLEGKEKLLAALFVPAVMQLLLEYKEEPELSEHLKWASIMGQKCRDLGLDLEDISSYANFAQELLKMPLQKLINSEIGE